MFRLFGFVFIGLVSMAEVWQRPSSIPFPKVWKTFKGLVEINGKIPEFWIQDIPEDMYENVVQIMTTGFNNNEPTRMCSEFSKDPVSVAEGQDRVRYALKQRLGFVCFTKDDNGIPEIASVCINYRLARNDPETEYKGKTIRRLRSLLNYVLHKNDFFEEFNVTEVLSDAGLYTFPKFSRQRISVELLNCREQLCESVGIEMTFSIFTNEKSQRVAEYAGFVEYTTMSFDELAKIDENYYIANIQKHVKYIKVMYRSYKRSSS